ncbi:MAG: hypothetical protein ISR65_03205 [Bacteriovoracaceae bacterium]|nr:hypothetical protein [Bacteriovoracaceae bacterium]
MTDQNYTLEKNSKVGFEIVEKPEPVVQQDIAKEFLTREDELYVAKQKLLHNLKVMITINQQLADDIDKVSTDNSKYLDSIRQLKTQYDTLISEHKTVVAQNKEVLAKITSARIGCNRLIGDMGFLKDENAKLTDWVNGKSKIFGELLDKMETVKRNYDFVVGEANFSEDILSSVESLVNKAFEQKKDITKKINVTKDKMDVLFNELSTSLKDKKMAFYQKQS